MKKEKFHGDFGIKQTRKRKKKMYKNCPYFAAYIFPSDTGMYKKSLRMGSFDKLRFDVELDIYNRVPITSIKSKIEATLKSEKSAGSIMLRSLYGGLFGTKWAIEESKLKAFKHAIDLYEMFPNAKNYDQTGDLKNKNSHYEKNFKIIFKHLRLDNKKPFFKEIKVTIDNNKSAKINLLSNSALNLDFGKHELVFSFGFPFPKINFSLFVDNDIEIGIISNKAIQFALINESL